MYVRMYVNRLLLCISCFLDSHTTARSLEIFLNALLTKGSEIAEQRKAKTLTPQHLYMM